MMKFRQLIKYYVKEFLRTVSVALCWMLVIFVFVTVGPIVEGKYIPVVTDINLTYAKQHKDYTQIIFEGTKKRSCEFIEVSAITGEKGRSLVKGKIVFEGYDSEGPKTRAQGRQTFGPWKIYPPGNEVILVAYHRCHLLWQTVTPLVHWEAS